MNIITTCLNTIDDIGLGVIISIIILLYTKTALLTILCLCQVACLICVMPFNIVCILMITYFLYLCCSIIWKNINYNVYDFSCMCISTMILCIYANLIKTTYTSNSITCAVYAYYIIYANMLRGCAKGIKTSHATKCMLALNVVIISPPLLIICYDLV